MSPSGAGSATCRLAGSGRPLLAKHDQPGVSVDGWLPGTHHCHSAGLLSSATACGGRSRQHRHGARRHARLVLAQVAASTFPVRRFAREFLHLRRGGLRTTPRAVRLARSPSHRWRRACFDVFARLPKVRDMHRRSSVAPLDRHTERRAVRGAAHEHRLEHRLRPVAGHGQDSKPPTSADPPDEQAGGRHAAACPAQRRLGRARFTEHVLRRGIPDLPRSHPQLAFPTECGFA
jgi:hypothetical protein